MHLGKTLKAKHGKIPAPTIKSLPYQPSAIVHFTKRTLWIIILYQIEMSAGPAAYLIPGCRW